MLEREYPTLAMSRAKEATPVALHDAYRQSLFQDCRLGLNINISSMLQDNRSDILLGKYHGLSALLNASEKKCSLSK